MRIALRVPPDGSLLSSLIYEGILKLYVISGERITPGGIELHDDALAEAFKLLKGSAAGKVELPTTGKNDFPSLRTFLSKYGVAIEDVASAKKGGGIAKVVPYGNVIRALSDQADRDPEAFRVSREIDLGLKLSKNSLLMDVKAPKDGLSLAIFKTDRYTSFTVNELVPLAKSLTLKLSHEAVAIGLLGLHAGYVGKVGNSHFFLFLQPHQVNEILHSAMSGRDPRMLGEAVLRARERALSLISEMVKAAVFPNTVLARVVLDLKLRDAIKGSNLRKISVRLVRLDVEGQTYKVYTDIPIDLYETYPATVKDKVEELAKHVSPDSPMVECISKAALAAGGARKVRQCCETGFLLRAVEHLYRYVCLGDPSSLSTYLRLLMDAARAAKANEDPKGVKRAKSYESWVMFYRKISRH